MSERLSRVRAIVNEVDRLEAELRRLDELPPLHPSDVLQWQDWNTGSSVIDNRKFFGELIEAGILELKSRARVRLEELTAQLDGVGVE